MSSVAVILVLASSLVTGFCKSPEVVQRKDGPGFTIRVDGYDWFSLSNIFSVHFDGAWWRTSNTETNILKKTSGSYYPGYDAFGSYNVIVHNWEGYENPYVPSTKPLQIETHFYQYDDILNPALSGLFLFEIVFLSPMSGASIENTTNQAISTYPSLAIDEIDGLDRGWLTWAGNMAKRAIVGVWGKDDMYSNMDGGFPLVVFNRDQTQAFVISPLNTLMSANQMFFTEPNTKQKMVTFGPMSTIDSVPAGYRFKTIMVYGNGVLNAMNQFGKLMRGYYGKSDNYRKSDFSINYLGYWTDNGACYYYNTSSQYSNYEDLLKAVKKDADDSGLPFRYIQLDSWWYYKGRGGGVSVWEAMPDVFPNGIEALVSATGWRVVAHNRYWAPDTPYAKDYKFIVEDSISLPVDPKFWDYLMSSSQRQWNLMVYEQDWLDLQFPRTNALLTELGLGEMWLKQMGDSAMRYGITIQYCMPWTRHILQSLTVPVVTQIRVSDDYQPSNSQWIVGDTTILSHAMGLAAFKDNFRTSTNQPDCKPYGDMSEHYPELETFVAALTAGPVGPSDMIGKANKTLIMATCMEDGRLLKPSYPAMSIDTTFVQRAFGSGGPDGQLWVAFSEIDGFSWYYVIAADLNSDYILTTKDLSPIHKASGIFMAYQYSIVTGKVTQILVPQNNTLRITKCGREDFQYWVVISIDRDLPTGIGRVLFGELNKIVPFSETRFSDITLDSVRLKGVVGEVVPVTVYDFNPGPGGTIFEVQCIIQPDGGATLNGLASSEEPTCG